MATHTLTERESGTVIAATPGDSLAVSLPEPGGGYRWQRSQQGQAVTFDSDEYSAATGYAIGAAQTRIFHYRAASPGTALLHFELRREWETSISPLETREFRVQVSA